MLGDTSLRCVPLSLHYGFSIEDLTDGRPTVSREGCQVDNRGDRGLGATHLRLRRLRPSFKSVALIEMTSASRQPYVTVACDEGAISASTSRRRAIIDPAAYAVASADAPHYAPPQHRCARRTALAATCAAWCAPVDGCIPWSPCRHCASVTWNELVRTRPGHHRWDAMLAYRRGRASNPLTGCGPSMTAMGEKMSLLIKNGE